MFLVSLFGGLLLWGHHPVQAGFLVSDSSTFHQPQHDGRSSQELVRVLHLFDFELLFDDLNDFFVFVVKVRATYRKVEVLPCLCLVGFDSDASFFEKFYDDDFEERGRFVYRKLDALDVAS